MQIIAQLLRNPNWLNRLDKILATLASAAAIFATAWLTHWQTPGGPILLASMGASAAILFAIPGSPLAKPWPLIGGHFSSGLIGVLLGYAIDDTLSAAAFTAGLSVLVMSMLRCLHPPGVATALIPVLNYPHANQPNLHFLLTPLAVNVFALLLLTLMINRVLLRRNYPATLTKPVHRHRPINANLLTIERDEVEQVLDDFGQFVDISTDELSQLFNRIQLQRLLNRFPKLTCRDIMQTNIQTLEYATEVETAWCLMHERQLKILPVLDKSRRVIGIVT